MITVRMTNPLPETGRYDRPDMFHVLQAEKDGKLAIDSGYDMSAVGFFFETSDEYNQKAAALPMDVWQTHQMLMHFDAACRRGQRGFGRAGTENQNFLGYGLYLRLFRC